MTELLDRLPIGEVRTPPGFDRPTNPGAAELIALCRSRGIRVRELVRGESIDHGPDVASEAIHPPLKYPAERPDNEHSIVLRITSEGRSLLLTGDLEGDALKQMLSGPALSCEALVAPHHGSRSANPRALYDWSQPRLVLISQRPPNGSVNAFPEWFTSPGRTVLTTWEQGAIRLLWEEHGVTARGYLDAGH